MAHEKAAGPYLFWKHRMQRGGSPAAWRSSTTILTGRWKATLFQANSIHSTLVVPVPTAVVLVFAKPKLGIPPILLRLGSLHDSSTLLSPSDLRGTNLEDHSQPPSIILRVPQFTSRALDSSVPRIQPGTHIVTPRFCSGPPARLMSQS